MAATNEYNWPQVTITGITVAGTLVTVSDIAGLHTNQQIILQNTGLNDFPVVIRRILSSTQFIVWSGASGVPQALDLTTYNGGTLIAPEQARVGPTNRTVIDAVYSEEPAMALRILAVDEYGNVADSTAAQIEALDPTARFIYGSSAQVLEIREFAPNAVVGDPLKSTQFTYDSSLNVTKIVTVIETVTSGDLV
jgi:hypothetical protein